jgi:phosphoribosylglycinamide formyltransferase-1
MIPIVIFASGRGSNFEAIHRAILHHQLSGVEVRAVLSDRPDAPVLDRARALGISALCVPYPQEGSPLSRREKHGKLILAELAKLKPHFIVLAGYMRILSVEVLEAFRAPQGYCRIVNIHPSLLPSFPGVNSYAQAYQYGVKVAGVTVHLVEEGVDTGPICAQ